MDEMKYHPEDMEEMEEMEEEYHSKDMDEMYYPEDMDSEDMYSEDMDDKDYVPDICSTVKCAKPSGPIECPAGGCTIEDCCASDPKGATCVVKCPEGYIIDLDGCNPKSSYLRSNKAMPECPSDCCRKNDCSKFHADKDCVPLQTFAEIVCAKTGCKRDECCAVPYPDNKMNTHYKKVGWGGF
ncbi:unnamed protein product [Chrysoparadoxa australica]